MNSLCPNPTICGSCSWAHIPYENQLKQKLSDINGSFALKKLSYECTEIIPSPVTAHYRNRMDFAINFEGKVGLREKGKWWRVIDAHPCFISTKEIETLFFAVRDWVKQAELSFYDRKAHSGLLRYAVIRSTSLNQTMVSIITSLPQDIEEEHLVQNKLSQLATSLNVSTLIWIVNRTESDVSHGDDIRIISGRGTILEEINGSRYEISPNSFFQTNSFAAPILQSKALEACRDLSQKTFLDLYCGSGFFSIPASKIAKRTVGVEIVEEAIEDAKRNAMLNASNAEFFCAKSEEFDWAQFKADIILVDPPRSGMHDDALKKLINVAPKELVYVSCNPKNFAREMVQLKELYNLVEMVAIDMFPHTPHVELVARLERH